MLLRIACFLLTLCMLPGCDNDNEKFDSSLKGRINAVIDDYLDDNPNSGMVVGIIQGDSTHIYGYGETSVSNDAVPDEQTIFEIGSITKTFTALSVTDIALQNNISLSTPAENYFPAGIQCPSYQGNKITIRHLLSHVSGLPRLPDNLISDPLFEEANPYKHYDTTKMFAFLNGYTLPRNPGVTYEYSNLGMGLAGVLGERISGLNYEQMVVSRICIPLELNDTRITLNAEQQSRLAAGHDAQGHEVSNWDFKAIAGAGAVRSTMNDMIRYAKSNMHMISSGLDQAMDSCHTLQFKQTGVMEIGLGWLFAYDDKQQKWLWHNGGTGGYSTFMAFRKESGLAVILLSNSEGDVTMLGVNLLNMIN